MSDTYQINNSYHNAWRFIEEYLPNYSNRDDVLQDDILLRFIEGDDVCEEDMEWVEKEFQSDKKEITNELVRLESRFMAEALQAYYDKKTQSASQML